MWLLAFVLFLGAKWLTAWRALPAGAGASLKRLLAYTLLWPGMDARAFLGSGGVPRPPDREWTLAGAKTLFGVALIWLGAPPLRATHPLLAGWVAMVGIIFVLHFGLFHLLSLLWRARGVDARPIMQAPAVAASLSAFWGGRWNRAFTDLMHGNFLSPLAKRLGPQRALFVIFLISGLLHEIVISLPARGGYGLPTAYFVLQAFGLRFERSEKGRRLGLGSGWKGRCFVALVAGAPAFWLFHPVFIHNVILPMLSAIGAT